MYDIEFHFEMQPCNLVEGKECKKSPQYKHFAKRHSRNPAQWFSLAASYTNTMDMHSIEHFIFRFSVVHRTDHVILIPRTCRGFSRSPNKRIVRVTVTCKCANAN